MSGDNLTDDQQDTRDTDQLTPDQLVVFNRLIDALDKRYTQMQRVLCSAINLLKEIADEAELADDPRSLAFDTILQALSIAAGDGARLQDEVADVLYNQLAQSQSAKAAYDQGWRDRLIDTLARATPEQIATLHTLLIE